MTTMLGKSSVWQPAKRADADDCEKNSQESRFHHFQDKGARLVASGYWRFAMRNTVTLDRDMKELGESHGNARSGKYLSQRLFINRGCWSALRSLQVSKERNAGAPDRSEDSRN
jgi:hypothetical protein